MLGLLRKLTQDLILKSYDIKFLKTDLKGFDYLWWIIGSLITYHLLFFLKILKIKFSIDLNKINN